MGIANFLAKERKLICKGDTETNKDIYRMQSGRTLLIYENMKAG